jgi:two-component system sensor histidine kinase SenX3
VLHAAVDALPFGVLVIGRDERVVYVNPAGVAMSAVRSGRITSRKLIRLAHEVRASGETAAADVELPRREPLVAQATATRARLGDDVIVVLHDVTDARRVEAVRRDFVANVSHELKTPVGALSLLAEAVVGASDDGEVVRPFAERMVRETARLSRLIQELIDLSRLQGAEPLPPSESVPVGGVVREALDRTRLAADTRGITVEVGGTAELWLRGDERLLATALANLLDNAINYSPAGTKVTVAALANGDEIELSVTDQGIGISADDTERIFERFYRADPARSRATGGTGLGLAIVKHIVTNHGGRVGVWSVEGAGSTFTLYLPAAVPDPVEPVAWKAASG